jgi:hypothetical protein
MGVGFPVAAGTISGESLTRNHNVVVVTHNHRLNVDRLSGAAAEAMKKMPTHQSSLRQVYGEDDWGPTVDGRILPRHPI